MDEPRSALLSLACAAVREERVECCLRNAHRCEDVVAVVPPGGVVTETHVDGRAGFLDIQKLSDGGLLVIVTAS